ncbi:MAG: glycoside hydrolase 43 family protein [Paludibacter sp.]|nr:glycoside hydrolase 43 family protein [Paludibacter sp.]
MFIDELKSQKNSALVSLLAENQKPYKSEVWVADLGNGQYKNPVLYADYSDPDVCRVGNDYYLTASSFSNTPALPILHSKDLVNWEIIAYAQLSLDERFSVPNHGDGVWAPSIRYHDGEFYIYYGDPDVGILMTKTRDVRGAWSPLTIVKAGKGLIDACPLWDDNGKVYLVHGYAGSRAGMKSMLAIFEMSPDGTQAITPDRVVFDGHNAQPTIEGPKFYKRNGYYYIFAPAGGVKPGWQLAMRSENVYGPYSEKTVLAQGKSNINGPHQGAWVTSPDGKEDWFLHFQDLYAYGRVVHLQPMTWVNDFPVIGIDPDGDGCGEPVTKHKKPSFAVSQAISTPAESDDFDNPTLGLQWQWQANSNPLWYYLNIRESYIRLFAWETATNSLWGASNLLLQKLPAPEFTASTKLTFSPYKNGERAGLTVFGMDYAAIVIEKAAAGLEIKQVVCKNADNGKTETTAETVKATSNTVYFRVVVKQTATHNSDKINQPRAHCTFYYSIDGNKFTKLGEEFEAREGKWIGAKVGIFCQRPVRSNDSGFADVDWFRIEK